MLMACNKNSLQLPDRQEDTVINHYLELNHVRVAELSFKQSANEIEGKTSLIFRNVSGLTLTELKVLIERGSGENSYRYYDSIRDQCIISIDTLHTSKTYTCDLPFRSGTLKNDHFNIKILSSGETAQLISGSYANVYLAFERSDKTVIRYGLVNGYVTADGEALFRIKDNTNYHQVNGNFVDTLLFNNGFLKIKSDSLAGPLSLDVLNPGQHFNLSNNNLGFRLKLSATLSDSTRYLFIKAQKK